MVFQGGLASLDIRGAARRNGTVMRSFRLQAWLIGRTTPSGAQQGLASTGRGGNWVKALPAVLAGVGCCWLAQAARGGVVRQTVYSTTPSQYSVSFSGLVQAADGNFYGTTPKSNFGGYGSVFRVTPAGVMTTLFGFGIKSYGLDPEGGLVLATDGNLYGTTASGGFYGRGTLFKITTTGTFQVVHPFNSSDGSLPMYNLVQASDGYLYGVTASSPTNVATLFRSTLAGTLTILTTFPAAMPADNAEPNDGLVEGPDGWLYGTVSIPSASYGKIGAIYKVSTTGGFQTLAYFYGTSGGQLPPTGDHPMCGLTVGRDGFLYGTAGREYSLFHTTYQGQVFRMTTDGVLTTLLTFNGTNGANPMTRLLAAPDGCLYGLTAQGGSNNGGTIFRLTTDGVLTTLASAFGIYATDQGFPALIQAADGNLYGTGMAGSFQSISATVFRLVEPPVITAAAWSGGTFTLAWNSFSNGAYRLAYKSALNDPTWTTQVSTITAIGPIASGSDLPGGAGQRFYRVVLLP
jgi:uncharacterized repeat protein (TIGR03803 family)